MHTIINRALFLLLLFISSCCTAFSLQAGDLLFSQETCGDFCKAIDLTTKGVDNARITHVAMVLNNPQAAPTRVIEAVPRGVIITPLNTFLANSVTTNGKPRVWVGRLKASYQPLIPTALEAAKHNLHKPYNQTFATNNHGESFYCSQLIYDSFFQANHQHAVFQLQPMNFKDPISGETLTIWQQYFRKLHQPVPQDEPGTSPGGLSRDPAITIVYRYFQPALTTS